MEGRGLGCWEVECGFSDGIGGRLKGDPIYLYSNQAGLAERGNVLEFSVYLLM